MKKVSKILLIITITLGCMLMFSGCKRDDDGGEDIQVVSNIELGKKQYIEQLVPIPINGTNDTLTITEEVKWETPEEEDGNTTVSFSIAIPYTIRVDGIDYDGIYELMDAKTVVEDHNPKYNLEVTNLTKNGETEVYLTLK